jgi:hypothetical protein
MKGSEPRREQSVPSTDARGEPSSGFYEAQDSEPRRGPSGTLTDFYKGQGFEPRQAPSRASTDARREPSSGFYEGQGPEPTQGPSGASTDAGGAPSPGFDQIWDTISTSQLPDNHKGETSLPLGEGSRPGQKTELEIVIDLINAFEFPPWPLD